MANFPPSFLTIFASVLEAPIRQWGSVRESNFDPHTNSRNHSNQILDCLNQAISARLPSYLNLTGPSEGDAHYDCGYDYGYDCDYDHDLCRLG